MKEKKKVIISGVTGMDGSIMVDYLLENTDYDIYGLVRHLSVENHDNIKHVNDFRFKKIDCDITDTVNIHKVIQDIKPDFWINFAANSFVAASWKMPRQVFLTNAVAVLDILEGIRLYTPRCKFINAGSSEEFGDVQYSPQDEKHPLRARSVYGASKIAAREITKVYRESYCLYAIQSISFNHEGVRRGKSFITRKITSEVARIHHEAMRGKSFEPIRVGNMAAKRDWSHAPCFIDGIWRMLNQEHYNPDFRYFLEIPEPERIKQLSKVIQEYVLASGETHTVAEFVEKSFYHAGIEAELRFAEPGNWKTATFYIKGTDVKLVEVDEQFYRPAEVDLLLGDSTRARKELGWKPKISFDELVRSMVVYDIANYRTKEAS